MENQSTSNVSLIGIAAPEVAVGGEREYGVLKGAEEVTWGRVVSTSYDNTSASFSAPPPKGWIVDRACYINVPVTVKIDREAGGVEPVYVADKDAFRAFPIANMTSSIQCTINNETFSMQTSDVIQPLLRCNIFPPDKDGVYSMTPSMLDQSQQYEYLEGSMRNPLASYEDSVEGGVMPRGGFYVQVAPNTPTTATILGRFTEPVFLSPWTWGCNREAGFTGVNTVDFTFNWVGGSDLAKRLWSRINRLDDSGRVITYTVTIGQPSLLFRYFKPRLSQFIPRISTHPYFEVSRFPTDTGAVMLDNETRRITSQLMILGSVPHRLVIFARRRTADMTVYNTDTFLEIQSCEIQWNGSAGKLSNASQQNLYQISRENQVALSWSQWSGGAFYTNNVLYGFGGTVGSVLVVRPGVDFGLDVGEAPGVIGQYNMIVNVTVRNISGDNLTPVLYVIAVNEGIFEVDNLTARKSIGTLTRQQVLMTDERPIPTITYSNLMDISRGGNFFSNLGSWMKNALKWGVKTLGPKVLEYGVPMAKAAMMGLGAQKPRKRIAGKGVSFDEDIEEVYTDGAKKSAGGAVMSRSHIFQRIYE